MSLIAVAAHLRHPRRLLHLVLLSVVVIAGLLAMHALNAHGTAMVHGVSTVPAVTVSPDPPHAGMTSAHAHGGESTASGIASTARPMSSGASAHDEHAPSGERSMAWMTCVLALLVAVIAFIVLAGVRAEGPRGLRPQMRPFRWTVVAHALPPPSLPVLCIRRT